jgi:hypothetical protein
MRKERHQDISPLVWLVFPILSYIFLYGVMLTGFPPSVARPLGSEQGVIENAQVLFLLLFIGLGSSILWRKTPLPHPRLRVWILLLIAGGRPPAPGEPKRILTNYGVNHGDQEPKPNANPASSAH